MCARFCIEYIPHFCFAKLARRKCLILVCWMDLNGQVIVAVKQLNQKGETAAFFRDAFGSKPFGAQLFTNFIQTLASQCSI
ncbi:hypothetical protein D3C76_1808240 [compost metagenome]